MTQRAYNVLFLCTGNSDEASSPRVRETGLDMEGLTLTARVVFRKGRFILMRWNS